MSQVENGVEDALLKSMELFCGAIDKKENLEIIGSERGDADKGEVLVIQNNDVGEDVEGHQVTVEVAEIFAQIRGTKLLTAEQTAEAFVRVVNNERDKVVLNGITRIVGYYSRVENWNKSKIGELRDRQNGQYGQVGFKKAHHDEACKAVDNR